MGFKSDIPSVVTVLTRKAELSPDIGMLALVNSILFLSILGCKALSYIFLHSPGIFPALAAPLPRCMVPLLYGYRAGPLCDPFILEADYRVQPEQDQR